MVDMAWDVFKVLAGAGVIGWLVSVIVMTLKSTGVVKRLHLEELLDMAASRLVGYVQDVSKETGASGKEQREQAVKALSQQTGIGEKEAEERVRAAYQKMKNGGGS